LGKPFMSLAKSTNKEEGKIVNHVVSVCACPKVANPYAQQFPS